MSKVQKVAPARFRSEYYCFNDYYLIKHYLIGAIIKCKHAKKTLNKQQKHIFQWIPSHGDLMGNERADLAKKGSRI